MSYCDGFGMVYDPMGEVLFCRGCSKCEPEKYPPEPEIDWKEEEESDND